ncbi:MULTISPECIES: helix-turn-helix domain-containing protein [unclassified Ruegeria]|uniref:helix-turn-helix domain-containing protein n=1 Tax=unclassified Ruegeria TaxID=2625375 RepID=UPI00148901FC|nr:MULTISPECIES: helix-turn-helix domain-containing protein [unclassified Ruegeria]
MPDSQEYCADSKIRGPKIWNPAESTVELAPNDIVIGRGQAAIMKLAHWHMQIELNYVFEGALTYEMCGREFTVEAGEIALFWGGLPHRLSECEDTTLVEAIHLPLSMYFRLRLPETIREALMQGSALLSKSRSREDRHAFRRICEYLRSGDAKLMQHAGEELILRIERIAFEDFVLASPNDASAVAPDPSTNEKVKRILDFLVENFREDLNASAVAEVARLHPKYAMSVFKRSTGVTMNEYIQLLRLNYSQAMLMRGTDNILKIATESGFGSLSNFNRCFRKHTGLSPTQFRSLAQ